MKTVSVIVTCYNHEKYIKQCIQSIFHQTYQNIELIIINDGSRDSSNEIITNTIKNSPFEQTDYIIQENKGSCFSRNRGLDISTGEYILMVDSDNYLPNDYIETMIKVLEDTGKDIAYASLKDADTGAIINEVPTFSLGLLLNTNFIDTCSLFKKSVLKDCRFDMKLNRLFMQDYDFFLNLIYNGAYPIKAEGIYQNYRVLPNSLGNRAEDTISRSEWFEIYQYIIGKYPSYCGAPANKFASWYISLSKELEVMKNDKNKLIRRFEMLSKKIEEKEQVILNQSNIIAEKDIRINELNAVYMDVVQSNSWKTGRKVTFPARKMKDIMLKMKRSNNEIKVTKELDRLQENFSLEKAKISSFSYNPLISILIPVYNVEKLWLEKCISSIEKQWYTNWEICIADDASTNTETLDYLKELEKNEKIKIDFRAENGHISAATNSALAMAQGEFIALVDNDDELSSDALHEVVKALNENKSLNLIYSDEDKIDGDGNHYDAHFKPDWSPDLILNQNYISHLGIYRTTVAIEIGGFRVGYEGSQDHDFLLRFTEKISDASIYHIPKILYYWRALEGSTASDQTTKSYAFDSGLRCVRDALDRRGISGEVTPSRYLGIYNVKYHLLKENMVSIIIPTRNGYDDVKLCVDSIIVQSTYKNYEIIIADNNSDDPNMEILYAIYKKRLRDRFKVTYLKIPFNYSRINNLAVQEANGEYLLFLNNDTSVISDDWIETMLGFAQFDRIGCVGAKLWYFDDTIQHAGVILGSGGVAKHTFLNADRNDAGYFSRLYADYNYTAVTAACLMVSKKDFELVNGFDETLAVAFNDVDLCIRIYQLGRNNVWAHNAELYHYESKSRGEEDTPEKRARFEGEIDIMIRKHKKILDEDPAYNSNFSLDSKPFTKIGR